MLYAYGLLDIAKNDVSDLENIKIFSLTDLFKAHEWNRISRNDCFLLGRLFYINITHHGFSSGVKTSSRQYKFQYPKKFFWR